MINILLPDGSARSLPNDACALDLANDISEGLARISIAAYINGQLLDLSTSLKDGDQVSLVTDRMQESLEVIRHSSAHLLAQAVKELYPSAQVTVGPVTENGFFYDFAYERPFTPEDLNEIEKHMLQISKNNVAIERLNWSREEAIRFFTAQGELYKVKLIERIAEGENISLYRQGDFVDLCRGPHVVHTGQLKAFKLLKVAGAYWEGDASSEQLQRISGTAWANKKELKAYFRRLEEAQKRDHRRLGVQHDLFHLQDEAPGMVFWHPKGWALWQSIAKEIRQRMVTWGYQEINTPQLVDRSLWEKSGHWDKFRDEMFTTQTDSRDYAIKPMNCPCHVQVFKQKLHSYRDLPLRLAEFGSCHRNEPSGALHGLMRLRNFVQDDAHIFCTEDQIGSEVSDFIDCVYEVYRCFGFDDILLKLSDRPEQRVGDDAQWDKAEQALHQALQAKDLSYELNPGEGAFYGPKIEFSLRDCLGRVWQCGTIQVDFSMPSRLGAEYVGQDNTKQTPVMLHRAICGSLERFIGILIEQYEAKFPFWLSPVQLMICNISEPQSEYANKIQQQMRKSGFRVDVDLRNEKVGYKVRAHTLDRVPFIAVVGEREMQDGTLNIRSRAGEQLGTMSLEAWIEQMQAFQRDYK
ncbi:MAG: threonine--tRNA ligase [Mariprofundaceae bacterium]|nr:threonine--tRNA ligase [Mariprofundaceae bacterium]